MFAVVRQAAKPECGVLMFWQKGSFLCTSAEGDCFWPGKLTPMPILTEDGKGGVVSSEEVERKVRELMGLEGKGFRESSSMMNIMAMAAWTNGGSSFAALPKLVASWKQEQS
ncbi:hypothetical protein NC651_039413 [Populus alba x Populus x berolinensis]|nr:hypothetical protein NC651_039413 [Populus alba x Populus x berolinensis]